jgi:hypothetical protein
MRLLAYCKTETGKHGAVEWLIVKFVKKGIFFSRYKKVISLGALLVNKKFIRKKKTRSWKSGGSVPLGQDNF